MTDIVITGASGFVGQNLYRGFADQGAAVLGLSLRKPVWPAQLPETATALIHLAGKAHDTANITDEAEYFKVNRDLTIALFDEFMASGIRDFFYFSSVKAVADTVDGPLTERETPKPETPYGRSKLAAEEDLLSRTIPENKRLFIIRPCMIHGPGNKGNLNLLYKIVKSGMPWPLGAFDNQRSFVSIDNVFFLIKGMLEKEALLSGIYHFADDEALSTNGLVTLIAECLGKRAKIWPIPARAIKAIAKIGDVSGLPLNTERLKKLTESYVVSNAKIKAALGIDKLPFSAKNGLEKTIENFVIL